jgi:hypothetical protein
MDAAADKAIKKFTQSVDQLSKKERDGAQFVIEFLKEWKTFAGYRRLGRYLITLKVNGPS